MSNLQLVTTEKFNNVSCDFYNYNNQMHMTRSQIGTALGYDNPSDSIRLIHNRHKQRLDKFSTPYKLNGVQDAYLYSQRGIFEICRWSRQPKADKFMDWVWDIAEQYRAGQLINVNEQQHQPISSDVQSQLLSDILNNQNTFSRQLSELDAEMDYYFDDSNVIKDRVLLLEKRVSLFNLQHEQPKQLNQPTQQSAIQQTVLDLIRDTIRPLAVLYNDGSTGYNCTFRKVYKEMNVDWKNRCTRYKNKTGTNKVSNLRLIEQDSKLLKMFIDTVNTMLEKVNSN